MSDVITRTCLIDISADDDLSTEINFGAPVKLAWIFIPSLDSTEIGLEAAVDRNNMEDSSGGTWADVATDISGTDDTSGGWFSLDTDGSDVIGLQHFRVTSVDGQSADREFILAGVLC